MAILTKTHLDGDVLQLNLGVTRLDAASARTFKQEVADVWTAEVKSVTIDMSAVRFIDSSGIGALLSVYKRLPQGGPSVRLSGVAPAVVSVIELLRLHRIFEISA
ncbi:MAG: STAS domain-containing protein [Opitutaceae bacterium]